MSCKSHGYFAVLCAFCLVACAELPQPMGCTCTAS